MPPTTQASSPAPTPVQKAMARLGLQTAIDFALHLPLRYEDETQLTPLVALREGITAQIEGTVVRSEVQLRGRRQLVVTLEDDQQEQLSLRFLHFYPSHQKTLRVGQRIRARGEPKLGFWGREMVHPQFKAVSPGAPLAQVLTPVYPSTAGLPQAYLRKAVLGGLQRADLREILPPHCVPSGLPSLQSALQYLHQPPPGVALDALEAHDHPAWQRLKFEELLAQQLSRLSAQAERARQKAPPMPNRPGGIRDRLLASLPFTLTAAQVRVSDEIVADLTRSTPMHRLLQGDVGAGKTVVAALAAANAIDAGWQCALMAPTEILAEQHFQKLANWLSPLGIQVAWLSGSRKGKARAQMVSQIADGQAMLVVGTHAVIQADVTFANLGLAIIDEQHRFGVAQRLSLRQKLETADLHPHMLMMSATPIPRTLAMTVFADLDVSTIDQLPPGRSPIVTKLFHDERRAQVMSTVATEARRGKQVYWVCPLVEESEKLDLQNATATHAELCAAMPDLRVGLVHGRMTATDKASVMAEFTQGDLAVLVCTTVIEVGVDVPNASVMVIEHAERFGLSQLHQLRGRVGRGSVASVCALLYTGPLSDTGKARLRTMVETQDGFEIARRDLEIRGPGEFLGARQSGTAMLRFADLQEDGGLLALARRAAQDLLKHHPKVVDQQLARWRGVRGEFLNA